MLYRVEHTDEQDSNTLSLPHRRLVAVLGSPALMLATLSRPLARSKHKEGAYDVEGGQHAQDTGDARSDGTAVIGMVQVTAFKAEKR